MTRHVDADEFLRLYDAQPTSNPEQYKALCPAHDDRNASLSIATGDKAKDRGYSCVFNCHAKCSAESVLAAKGLTKDNLKLPQPPRQSGGLNIERTYPYKDEHGQVICEAVRLIPKSFRQRIPDGRGGWIWQGSARKVPYRLPELLAADPLDTFYIVEGEKDADRLAALGLHTTTNIAGAGNWKNTETDVFRGREVIILPDNDDAGRKHSHDVASKLRGIAAEIRIVELPGLPSKGDVSDFLNQGHTLEELLELVERTPAYDFALPPPAAEPSPTSPPHFVIGQKVRAGDRGNIGEVIDVTATECTVRFVNPDSGSTATKTFPYAELTSLGAAATGEPSPPFELELIDSAAFAAASYRREFLVGGVIVARQPCIIGGSQKTLKTSIAVDLAYSLGTATRFLNKFDVPQARRVAVISGESGEATLQDTATRIAHSRGRLLGDALVYWGFKLPQLGINEHLQAIRKAVDDHGIEVVIIDPAYLCMLRGENGSSVNFANLFEVGSLLLKVSQVFAGADCTPIILHHESKGAMNVRQNAPMELQHLSMSGFAEWARQWLLISRREAYEHGTGRHKLWMNIGGSAGHGGLWAVDVNEGQLGEDFGGRKWEVAVNTQSEAKSSVAAEKLEKHQRQILEALEEFPDGATEKQLRVAAKLNPANFKPAVEAMKEQGILVECEIKSDRGKKYPGVRFNEISPEQRNNSAEQPLFLTA